VNSSGSDFLADFPIEIDRGISELSRQTAVVIESVCGSSPRAKDVADGFAIHAKLGWQFWNVAYGGTLAALKCMPNDAGFDSLASAGNRKGVPKDLLAELRRLRENLSGVFAIHAEDRDMLQMMLEARAQNPDIESVLRWRKSSFLGNSMVRLHGLIDLVRTRSGVRWPIATLVVEKEGETPTFRREPLAPKGWTPDSVPLLTEFCSQPVPRADRRIERGVIFDELSPSVIGLTGKSTIFSGEVIHNVGPVKSDRVGEIAHFGSGIRTPAEFLISDHIVHKSLFPGVERRLRVYSELTTQQAREEHDLIPVPERLDHLGSGLSRVRTADVPRYAELLNHVFDRIGQDPDEFDVYRIRMPYPPIPASVMVQHPLPNSE
jgi:hypothetical protein